MSLSNIGLDPNNEEGDWSGCELWMISTQIVVFGCPLPFEGGMPMSLVVGDTGFEANIVSSDWIQRLECISECSKSVWLSCEL